MFDPSQHAFHAFGDAYTANPWPVYAALREYAPVHVGQYGIVYLSTYPYVQMVLGDKAERFSANAPIRMLEQVAGPGSASRVFAQWLFFTDPPRHESLSKPVKKVFTPGVIDRQRPHIVSLAENLLRAVQEREAGESGAMEIVADYALPLPFLLMCRLLGISTEDSEQLQEVQAWTNDAAGAFALTPEAIARGNAAMEKATHFFEKLLVARRSAPRDDVLSQLVMSSGGRNGLDEEELVALSILLSMAGYETSKDLIACLVLSLMTHSEALHELRACNWEKSRNVVEEGLRWWSPTQFEMFRAQVDITLPEGVIHADQTVVPLIGAANRDPSIFPRPDEFDLHRENAARHLAFGHGIHFCLGAPLVRLLSSVAIQTLFSRMDLLADPTSTLEWKPGLFLRGLKRLPVRWQLAKERVVSVG